MPYILSKIKELSMIDVILELKKDVTTLSSSTNMNIPTIHSKNPKEEAIEC